MPILLLVAAATVLVISQSEKSAFLSSRAGNRAQQQQQQLAVFEGRPALELAVAPALGTSLFASEAFAADAAGTASSSPLPIALGAVALLAVAGVALLSSEPPSESVDDKSVVTNYFNGEGFNRWSKIYGETEDVNPVQKDIRVGHGVTVEKILTWLDDASISGKTVCDAGCGTGNLSIPLASRGAVVNGSDISSAMVGEAARKAEETLAGTTSQMPKFETRDLEALEGTYDTVCCVDVLIHYPPERLDAMVGNLARLSKERLVLSFAPKTWYYVALKRIGELFPGKSKTTRAYLHEEEVVEKALNKAGFEVTRREMTSTNFYFSRLLEARPVGA